MLTYKLQQRLTAVQFASYFATLTSMTRLLQEAIDRLRQLPESLQDNAARALITQLEEEAEPEDLAAIEEGRMEIHRGDFVTLGQWRHDMGLPDRKSR
jgi:predicted transcriptional regulator